MRTATPRNPQVVWTPHVTGDDPQQKIGSCPSRVLWGHSFRPFVNLYIPSEAGLRSHNLLLLPPCKPSLSPLYPPILTYFSCIDHPQCTLVPPSLPPSPLADLGSLCHQPSPNPISRLRAHFVLLPPSPNPSRPQRNPASS